MMRWRKEKRREKGKRGEVSCKLTTNFDTRTKKFCEIDKCAMY